MYILIEKSETPRGLEHGEDLQELCQSLEYGDVAEGEFQIWELPSGRKFSLMVDRAVPESQYYLTPFQKNGAIWLPKPELLETDKEAVEAVYKKMLESR